MGVYIKMEMPENCALCPVWDAGNCLVATEVIICEYTKRPSDCPLVHVQPHGRLIDADALKQNTYEIYDPMGIIEAVPVDVIDNAPTVIEAEGKT